MFNFLVACASTSSSAGGCYDWPVIKQIVDLLGYVVKYIYMFLEWIGIPGLGLCIILLTLVIKFILLPMTIKQQKFTKLSNFAQPEIRAIQAKYQGKRDNYSMTAMQEETKAVYAKYGISQSMGCLQSFIQLPILMALYGAIRKIPVFVDSMNVLYTNVIEAIGNTDVSSISQLASWPSLTSDVDKMITLFALPAKGWNEMMSLFSGSALDIIQTNYSQIEQINYFGPINLGDTPWNQMLAGEIGIIAILVPLVSGFTQWLSVKLTQTASNNQNNKDQMAATMNSMSIVMPLFSVFICFTLNAAIGLYWCISSIFQCVLQIIINKHYRKIDMDAFIEENKKKAEEKAKKKREKAGVKGSVISSAANISTKNIENQAQTSYKPRSISDIANMNVDDPQAPARKPASNSLAAKAAMVQEYNDEHPEEAQGAKRKYKK